MRQVVDDLSWQDHPLALGVSIKPLISREHDGIDLTCMLVLIPRGREVPTHVHQDQDDIIYPIKGRARMWIDGDGSFDLVPGLVVRVPRGTSHKIDQVTDDVLLYDVFFPGL